MKASNLALDFHKKRKGLLHEIWKNKIAYLFLLPKLIMFSIFVAIPIVWAFLLAFQDYGVLKSTWVGLKNFKHVFSDSNFGIAMLNTIKFTIVTVPANVIIALVISSLIYPLGNKSQSFFRAAFYLPTVTSAVIISMVWRWIYNYQYGLANYVLGWFGIAPINWLGQSASALWALIIMSILIPFGVGIILYLERWGRLMSRFMKRPRLTARADSADGGISPCLC